MTKKIISLVLAVILVFSLAACASEATDSTKSTDQPETTESADPGTSETSETNEGNPWEGKRIGVAHITLYDEWCAAVRDEFIEQGEALGFAEVNVQDGNLNAETQQKLVEDFITKQYDMIMIDPVSPEGIMPTLDKAKEAGIPVIAFDSATPWTDLVSYIAWDHGETGVLTGKYIADYARENLDGKLDVAILAMLDAPHTAIRSEKFKETVIAELGEENVNIVFEQDFGQTRDSASTIVTNNLGRKVDVIWCAVDNAAFGAKVALEAKGDTTTKIVSAGGWGKEPFETINNGDPNYMMVIGVSPANIVADSLEAATKYFAGDSDIPERKDIELSIIDSSNISEYMKYVE